MSNLEPTGIDKAIILGAAANTKLEEHGVNEGGLKRKAWKKIEATWREAFSIDQIDTMDRLLWQIQQASIAWGLPTDEEMAA